MFSAARGAFYQGFARFAIFCAAGLQYRQPSHKSCAEQRLFSTCYLPNPANPPSGTARRS
jgi:hypothetical protein